MVHSWRHSSMAQVKALLRVSTVSPEDIAVFSEALISCKTALICLNVKENDILINRMKLFFGHFKNQSKYIAY